MAQNSNIPLALLLRAMAAESCPNAVLGSLSIATRHAPHVFANAPKARPLFSLSRYCHIGTPLAHDYWFISGAQMLKEEGTHIVMDSQCGAHDDGDALGGLDWPAVKDMLTSLPLDRDWAQVQRSAYDNTDRRYPLWTREDPAQDHCVVWMPLLGTSRGVGRPAPPAHVPRATKGPLSALAPRLGPRQHECVALVVFNGAERAEDIIDIGRSIALTGDGSDAAVWDLHARLCEWLEVVCCDKDDPYYAGRVAAGLRARGFPVRVDGRVGNGGVPGNKGGGRPRKGASATDSASSATTPSKAELLERVAVLEALCREHGIDA
ncbi:MAG: hypothetical protein RL260_3891 [Pseudomonadota bacterium]|jgi:hypothetical protein